MNNKGRSTKEILGGITDSMKIEILKGLELGITQKDISDITGISINIISLIKKVGI